MHERIRDMNRNSVLSSVCFPSFAGFRARFFQGSVAESAEMLATRPELAKMLITHRFPIEDAAEAFRVAQDRSQGVFGVVVEPWWRLTVGLSGRRG